MNQRLNVAIIGPGNIGIDLMMKIAKVKNLDLVMVAGIDKESKGLKMASERGIAVTYNGIKGMMESGVKFDLAFDCTSAKAHMNHATIFKEKGVFVIDLTPAAVGELVIPTVNLQQVITEENTTRNVNMITCGGQAVVPLAYAIQRVTPVHYAEMVTGASAEAVGPAGRSNSHEFKVATRRALLEIAGVEEAKVINIINPAVPPAIMRNTLYAVCDLSKFSKICDSIDNMVASIQRFVPGYRLKIKPRIDDDHIVVMNEVESACDYLPKYAGSLDIITAGAVEVAKGFADKKLRGENNHE